ncbi:MAG: helix-turn-helix domain-containing protein [Cyclobacteriaceae bacterium]
MLTLKMEAMHDIMTLEEVANYLKMKPQTIYTWAQSGKIPAAKIGKEWRFRRSIVDEWFNAHIDEKFQDIVKKAEKKGDNVRNLRTG